MPELTSAPSLLPLYVRAAAMGRRHHGDTLSGSVYTLADQSIDADHLVAYQHVCGFRVSDVLPPTYLHVLAFPLSLALMTERAFPFPLVGLVHVANTITVTRPVASGERVSFTVHAEDLRPHPAGRQVDLVAAASVGDEVVWTGRSTYLRRGARTGDKPPRTKLAEQRGPLVMVRVPGDIGRRYAAVSGDRNPIHQHALSARAFGFPRAIAHGMWLKARALVTLEGRLAPACTVDVAFKVPVPLPSTVAMSAVAVSTVDGADGWALDVRSASGEPHLAGTVS